MRTYPELVAGRAEGDSKNKLNAASQGRDMQLHTLHPRLTRNLDAHLPHNLEGGLGLSSHKLWQRYGVWLANGNDASHRQQHRQKSRSYQDLRSGRDPASNLCWTLVGNGWNQKRQRHRFRSRTKAPDMCMGSRLGKAAKFALSNGRRSNRSQSNVCMESRQPRRSSKLTPPRRRKRRKTRLPAASSVARRIRSV